MIWISFAELIVHVPPTTPAPRQVCWSVVALSATSSQESTESVSSTSPQMAMAARLRLSRVVHSDKSQPNSTRLTLPHSIALTRCSAVGVETATAASSQLIDHSSHVFGVRRCIASLATCHNIEGIYYTKYHDSRFGFKIHINTYNSIRYNSRKSADCEFELRAQIPPCVRKYKYTFPLW
jgi:hypothetical protein